MKTKSDLLKELGWDEKLIRQFMIDDSIISENTSEISQVEIYETSSLTISYNALPTGSTVQIKDGKK